MWIPISSCQYQYWYEYQNECIAIWCEYECGKECKIEWMQIQL